MINLLIVGYHGFGNCGDEAILFAMKNNIQKLNKDVIITALSYQPEETKAAYHINAVQRFSIRSVFLQILQSDIVISGGGTLLQDETSTRSLMYYLSIIWLAKRLGKKVMLYSNGIGPVRKYWNRYLIKKIVNQVDLITLRDASSERELKKLGVTKPPIYTTADPAFSLEPIPSWKAKNLLAAENIPLDRPIAGISIREWKDNKAFLACVASICDYLVERYHMNIVVIPMQYPKDLEISYALQNTMKHTCYLLKEKYKAEETLGMIGCFHITFSMRLHALIFSAIEKTPLIGIVYDPKVEYYLKLLNMPQAGDVRIGLDLEKCISVVDDVMRNHYQYTVLLQEKISVLTEKVKRNDAYLLDLLNLIRAE